MKIIRAEHGYGGYDDVMFGTSFTFEGSGCGISDFLGWWPLSYVRSERAAWTDDDRNRFFLEAQLKLEKILKDAKVRSVGDLVGKPVEVTIVNSALESWRILTEVI